MKNKSKYINNKKDDVRKENQPETSKEKASNV